MVVLNIMDTGDREKAAAGIEIIARELGQSLEDTAEKVFKTCCTIILKKPLK